MLSVTPTSGVGRTAGRFAAQPESRTPPRNTPGLGGFDTRAGVAVLMRYTLRLLTIQQFQRAAALVCACETLRRSDSAVWGQVPFRIGFG